MKLLSFNKVILIFATMFIIASFFVIRSGYDEMGVISTIYELHFESTQEEYARYIGVDIESYRWAIIQPLIHLLVVPIRWTYSIGFFPVLSIVSWFNDSPYLIYVLHNIMSVLLLIYGLNKLFFDEKNRTLKLTTTVLGLVSSGVLVHWQYSISSYSYTASVVVIFFALARNIFKNEPYRLHPLTVSFLPLLTYQIIPYVFTLCFIDFLMRRHIRSTLNFWFPAVITSVGSVLFLKLRSTISGSHSKSGWQFRDGTQFFNIPSDATFNFLFSEVSEYVRAVIQFFYGNPPSLAFWYRDHTLAKHEVGLYFSFACIILIYAFLARRNWATKCFILIFSTTIVLYAIQLLPIIVSRHMNLVWVSLILFFAISIVDTITKNKTTYFKPLVLKFAVLFIIPSILILQIVKGNRLVLEYNFPPDILSGSMVVLENCSGDFGFVGNLLNASSVIHRCGSKEILLQYNDTPVNSLFVRGQYDDCKNLGNDYDGLLPLNRVVRWESLEFNNLEGCLATWIMIE